MVVGGIDAPALTPWGGVEKGIRNGEEAEDRMEWIGPRLRARIPRNC